jgi:hypothetical protein
MQHLRASFGQRGCAWWLGVGDLEWRLDEMVVVIHTEIKKIKKIKNKQK